MKLAARSPPYSGPEQWGSRWRGAHALFHEVFGRGAVARCGDSSGTFGGPAAPCAGTGNFGRRCRLPAGASGRNLLVRDLFPGCRAVLPTRGSRTGLRFFRMLPGQEGLEKALLRGGFGKNAALGGRASYKPGPGPSLCLFYRPQAWAASFPEARLLQNALSFLAIFPWLGCLFLSKIRALEHFLYPQYALFLWLRRPPRVRRGGKALLAEPTARPGDSSGVSGGLDSMVLLEAMHRRRLVGRERSVRACWSCT